MSEPFGYLGVDSTTMDGFPKPGDRMAFLGDNGYPFELELAKATFEVGQELVVERCKVGGWSHHVWFEGHEGWYNGVMFEPVDEGAGKARAPWTDEQVRGLNEFQACGHAHPFTCPGEGDCPSRNLIATNEGWVCACGGYTQDWAHYGMLLGAPPNPLGFMFGGASAPGPKAGESE